MISNRDLFERLVRQVLSADHHDEALEMEADCYAESGTQLAWEVFQAVLKLPTETVDNPVETSAPAPVPTVGARDVGSLDEVKPIVDAWLQQRDTSMDGQTYVAALQLAATVKAALSAAVAPAVDAGAHEVMPCPFCGASAREPENITRGKSPTWEVGCACFCVSIRRATRKQAVTDWNKRAALSARAPDAVAGETVPKWVFDDQVKTLEPAWNYIQTHQEQFNAQAGDDKNAILVEHFLQSVSEPKALLADAVRAFLTELAGFHGQMVKGNWLSAEAARLLRESEAQ